MLSRLRPRSIYDVMAAIACFAALAGGTAYAANTIGSTDIIDGQVASVDIKDQDILSADVKDQSLTTFDVSTFLGIDVVDGTLTGDDVGDNSLTGADIDESSLALAVEPVTPVPASGANGFATQWGNDSDFGGPAGYWKDPTGVVHLRGAVSQARRHGRPAHLHPARGLSAGLRRAVHRGNPVSHPRPGSDHGERAGAGVLRLGV